MSRTICYALVSTVAQDLQLQLDALAEAGELTFHVFSNLAQFERRLIQERATAGLTAARARGRLGGRRPITGTGPRVQAAKRLNQDLSLGIDEICQTLWIFRSTLCRYLAIP